jgi:hypothetical protein
MTKQVIGKAGSPRRRWSILIALAAALAGGLIYIAGAQAVHGAGLFELDVASANAEDGVGSVLAGDDWDLICKAHPTTCTFQTGETPAGTQTASVSSHVSDGNLDATIFHGGGSKDGLPIAGWLWKDGAGGLPDKDNLLHAYAARYSKATDAGCPSTGATCEVIYFGSDRYANDGDATQAFWFLQNPIAANGAASQGGFKFTGNGHKDGDLLVISEFSNGGTTSTITVYRWTGNDATGGLTLLGGGSNKSCFIVTNPDPFCGIVNTDTTPTNAPWEFSDKAASTDFRQGEFFEAGINISDSSINLGGECFSSFVAETRSSTATTATLKDFVLGGFQSCQPGMTTQVSNAGPVAPGTSLTDTARITITGALNPADPTGTVTFFLCGPGATGCSTGGNNVGTGTLENQTGGTTTDGIAVATSPTVNDSTKTGNNGTLGVGRYCFRAEWPGDGNYGAASHQNNTTECFTVQDTTAITSAQEWLPNDEATVASGSGNTPISGTLAFTLFSGDNCGETSASKLYPAASASESFTLTNASTLADRTKKTTNTTVKVTATGETKVSWKVVFTPASGSNLTSSSHCETTTLNLTN